MTTQILTLLKTETVKLGQAGLLRRELVLSTAADENLVTGDKRLQNFASDDYLGLATDATLKRVAKAAIDEYGVGRSAPRMATGTLGLHQQLEAALSSFLGTESSLVFASGYHANTGVLESLVGERDFVFCDEQAHPSLADGVRLSRAKIYSYRNNDMDHLEDRLRRSRGARFRVIVTDGVFALDGELANLRAITDLAARYDAMVVVNEAQALGVLGEHGRGTAEHFGVEGRVDVFCGSFAHALGAGAGGYVSGRREVVEWLRQKSRPYLVSGALAPASTAAAKQALELVAAYGEERKALREDVVLFRNALGASGLRVREGVHPIVCVHVGDAVMTQRLADLLFRKGLFVMGFCHPVVPEGQARLRAQVTARHGAAGLRTAAATFAAAARELGLV